MDRFEPTGARGAASLVRAEGGGHGSHSAHAVDGRGPDARRDGDTLDHDILPGRSLLCYRDACYLNGREMILEGENDDPGRSRLPSSGPWQTTTWSSG